MKVLIDMNLSPQWVSALARNGYEAIHWSAVGDGRATDRTIMEWARANGYIVFTNDLDFGAILAVTHAEGPSVIQIRTQDVTPDHLETLIVGALKQYASIIEEGALIILHQAKARVRILPLVH